MIKWMPVNPCDTCPEKPCSFGCMPYAGYYDSIKAQRKLLEYLIANAWPAVDDKTCGSEVLVVGKSMLEKMLKELEESK